MELDWTETDLIIANGLREDGAGTDVTTTALFDATESGRAILRTKEDGIIAGLPVAARVFVHLDRNVEFIPKVEEGERVGAGQDIAEISGTKRALLSGERLAVNLLQRMSGIASLAAEYVRQVEGLPVKILDTRKTAPGLRVLDKYAVRCGGATNHRMSLYDMVMIKDNHADLAGGIGKAIASVKEYLAERSLALPIEVETRNLKEVQQVIDAGGVQRIMLDNYDFRTLRQAVQLIAKRYETEASGGITLANARGYAECGVDFISVGALTHSVPSLDLSLKAM